MLDVGVKIAGALQTAHDRGLLHRDIKPQNLFVSEFGEPALGDFGISTLDDERSISGGGGLTVHYAPPEVLEGAPATPRSDVYSFAATLYTLLEGARPFVAPAGTKQSVGDLARRIMLEDPPRVRRPEVPRSLAALLVGAMAKRPDDRPATAGDLGAALQQVQAELGLPGHGAAGGHGDGRAGCPGDRHHDRARNGRGRLPSRSATTTTTATRSPSPVAAPAAPAPDVPPSRRATGGSCSGRLPGSSACCSWPARCWCSAGDDDGGDDPDSTAPATTQLLGFARRRRRG